jgi:hypothetical protein
MKSAGPLAAGALGALAATLTITTIAASRARARQGPTVLEFVTETPDGYRFTELVTPAAIREVSELVQAALDPWISMVQNGNARAFVMAELEGTHHVAFIARAVPDGLVLDAAFGENNTLVQPAELEQIYRFLSNSTMQHQAAK